MVDLVFVVDEPESWHAENIQMNWGHYSGLKYLGARTISSIQERMASGVYYNPFVTVEGQVRKLALKFFTKIIILLFNLAVKIWSDKYQSSRAGFKTLE
jgi:hypothetical protein